MFIDSSLIYCEKAILKENPTVYCYFKDLPLKKRYSVYVLFNFCLAVKTIIDNNVDSLKSIFLLDKLESKLLHFKMDKTFTDDPFWTALRIVFNEYNMSIQPFKNIINANRMNLKHKNIISMDDLLKYCDYAGVSEGIMLMPIFKKDKLLDEDKKRLINSISELWKGVQLVKILKDLKYDLKRGRIYLPDSLFIRFKYTKLQLENGVIDENFTNMWKYIANFALNSIYYTEVNLDVFSDDCLSSVKYIINFQRMILNEIRLNNYNYLNSNFDIIRKVKGFNEKVLPADILN